jgi:hypothetical protein
VFNRENIMDNDKRFELIRLSATDFESFRKQFETLPPAKQMDFKNHMEKIHAYLKDNENNKMKSITGFPPPS